MAEVALLYASGHFDFDEVDHEGTHLSDDEASLHEADYTKTSLMSDGEDEDEDVGLQETLAVSQLEMENVLRQEELEFQRAAEASKDADQDMKLKLDTERAIEMSLEQERALKEIREAQEEGLGRFAAESPSDPSLDRSNYPSSVSTVSPGATESRSRHHPFLSPPASIIFNANETIPSGFNSLGANTAVPIGSDSGPTVTDININAYPLLPESPFTSSTDLQLPDDKNNLAYAVGHTQIPPNDFAATAEPSSNFPSIERSS